jgi:hypothetical protein
MTDLPSGRGRLPSPAQPLFILAMDQRDSFQRTLFGVTSAPTAQQLASQRDAKSLIFAAAERLAGRAVTGPTRAAPSYLPG